ncbi:g10338 [Coccomyxa viridis]|uniref:G10338 protein n=1 Tax=Coccomyxa viridis TaxID=1274662 RepID=A0ABP1G7U4_9CHLO
MILRHLRRTAPSWQAQSEAMARWTVSGQYAAERGASEHAWHRSERPIRIVPGMEDANSESREQTTSPASSKDMMAVFTCTKCDTRSAKPFSKRAYEHGVVIVQCPGCKGRHLLADRLGWFGEDGSVEDILARHGQDVKKVTTRDDGTLELAMGDILGQSGDDSSQS